MPIDTLLFDLDGTLYPVASGYESHFRARTFQFMVERLGVESVEKAEQMWRDLFPKYNQTLKTLRDGYGFSFDVQEYWEYVREGRERFLAPEPEVLALLQALPQRKIVFTNCAELQAQQALHTLGLLDCIEHVYGADFMEDLAKPQEEAFQRVCSHAKCDPATTAMFEDSLKNLKTAKGLGMTTCLIQSATLAAEGAGKAEVDACCDAVVTKCGLAEVKAALPQLWS